MVKVRNRSMLGRDRCVEAIDMRGNIVYIYVYKCIFQGMLASLLPIGALGHFVYMLHVCLLYSMYAFEYKWFNMGRWCYKYKH